MSKRGGVSGSAKRVSIASSSGRGFGVVGFVCVWRLRWDVWIGSLVQGDPEVVARCVTGVLECVVGDGEGSMSLTSNVGIGWVSGISQRGGVSGMLKRVVIIPVGDLLVFVCVFDFEVDFVGAW